MHLRELLSYHPNTYHNHHHNQLNNHPTIHSPHNLNRFTHRNLSHNHPTTTTPDKVRPQILTNSINK